MAKQFTAADLIGERVQILGTSIVGVVTGESTSGFVIVTSDSTALCLPIRIDGLEIRL